MAWFRRQVAIVLNTIREAIRSKVLGSLLFAAVLLILGSLVLGEMSVRKHVRVAKDVSMFATAVFAAIMAVYTAVTLLHTELERQTIYAILSKPVRRWEFVLGKFVGILCLVTGLIAVLFLASWAVVGYQGGQIGWTFVAAYGCLVLQMAILVAIALFVATFASPLLSGVFALAVFIAGNLQSQLEGMEKMLREQKNAGLTYVVEVLQKILPDLEALSLFEEVTYVLYIPPSFYLSAVWYATSYTAVVLLLAMVSFSWKDLS